MNSSHGDSSGLLVAGVANYSGTGALYGGQFSLISNYSHGFHGLQFSAANISSAKSSGLQIGALNVALEEHRGWQFAYFFNYSYGLKGIQTAVVNINGDYANGVQIGLYNDVGTLQKGFQLGFLNLIHDESEASQPYQIGLVNYSDDPNSLPLGFLNLIKGGRFDLELSRDFLGFNRTAILSGNKRFLFRLFVPSSIIPFNNSDHKVYGVGLALRFGIMDSINLGLDHNILYYNDLKVNRVSEWESRLEWEVNHTLRPWVGVAYMIYEDKYRRNYLPEESELVGINFGVNLNLISFWK